VPGFIEGEPLPVSVEAVSEALTLTLRARGSQAPFALVGYSSGGWLAHALASRLESIGLPATAVVLIDTYPAAEEATAEVLRVMLDESLKNGFDGPMSDGRLTAMGAYMRLFADWHPAEIAAPTLLIRADTPLVGHPRDGEWRARWDMSHDCVDVPGDHFALIGDRVESTAAAVEEWLVSTIENMEVEDVC
jgi:polyketide synthase 7